METSSPKGETLIPLGKCFKAHGLKGGMIFQLFNSHPQETSLKKGTLLQIFPLSDKSSLPREGKSFQVKSLSFGPQVIGYFEGVADRTMVDSLLPFELRIARAQLPVLTGEGEYYLSDLIGLAAIDHTSGKTIGFIKSFYDNGAQVILVIGREKGGEVGEDLDLPFLTAFFPVVDVAGKRAEIILPQYLD